MGWLVRQFCPFRSHAWPARETTEAVTVTVVGFDIVVVLGRERVECAVVGCVFDGGHVLAVGVPLDVVWARAGHQFINLGILTATGIAFLFQLWEIFRERIGGATA